MIQIKNTTLHNKIGIRVFFSFWDERLKSDEEGYMGMVLRQR